MTNVGMYIYYLEERIVPIIFILSLLMCFVRLSNPNIRQWMVDNNILSTKNLHKYYADQILDIARNINVTPIVWQDVWDQKVEVQIPFLFFFIELYFCFYFFVFSYLQRLLFKYGKIRVITLNLVHGLHM